MKVDPVIENGNSYPETKTISTENGSPPETQDKDVVLEGLASVAVYDQWVAPSVSGQRPKARYEVSVCFLFLEHEFVVILFFHVNKLLSNMQHGAAVVNDRMYIFGGNHNGRYLNDLQVLNFLVHTLAVHE